MAGVTDRPFRQLCRQPGRRDDGFGDDQQPAGAARTAARPGCAWITSGEPGPIIVQIAGGIPQMMAEAARYNQSTRCADHRHQHGLPGEEGLQGRRRLRAAERLQAGRIDPARGGRCGIGAGHAQNSHRLVAREHRNALEVARIAEDCGIQALTVHGRTREDKYLGEAPSTKPFARVKKGVDIPVIANGDIDSPKKAEMVMDFTAADAIMVGRTAQQRPWIFGQIESYFDTGLDPEEPTDELKQGTG